MPTASRQAVGFERKTMANTFAKVKSVIVKVDDIVMVRKALGNPNQKETADSIYHAKVLFRDGEERAVFRGKSDEVDEFLKDIYNNIN